MTGPARAAHPRPYYDDPYTTAFETRVSEERKDERGHWLRLEPSYFYPTGGGQESDRGTLGKAAVVDVEEDDAGLVWHRVEAAPDGRGPAVGDTIMATIDAGRRSGFRQQHTGQHVLSQAFEKLLGAFTLSSRLGEFEGSIDLERATLTWDEVEQVEEAANRVVFENRPVHSKVVPPDELARFPLRKPPKVDGPVRLIIVEDWDVSPCGGTHCTSTGEIGPIKVRRWEKWKGGVRVEFLCGARALADYQDRVRAMVEAGQRQHTSDREVLDVLERAAAERAVLSKALKRANEQLAEAEAASWAASQAAGADVGGGARGWARMLAERDVPGLKALAAAALRRGAPLVVLAARAPEPALIVMRPREKSEPDLRAALPALLDAAQGKGGGGADMLTILARDQSSLESAFAKALENLGIPRPPGDAT